MLHHPSLLHQVQAQKRQARGPRSDSMRTQALLQQHRRVLAWTLRRRRCEHGSQPVRCSMDGLLIRLPSLFTRRYWWKPSTQEWLRFRLHASSGSMLPCATCWRKSFQRARHRQIAADIRQLLNGDAHNVRGSRPLAAGGTRSGLMGIGACRRDRISMPTAAASGNSRCILKTAC